MRYNLEEREEFITLRAQGYSFDRIAERLGRAKQTLIDWNKQLQEEIATRKAIELEALYEKYFLLKTSRLSSFGEMLIKIKEELSERDLSDVPTDKLLDLFLKFHTQVKDELVELTFKSSGEIEQEKADRELMEELTRLTANRDKVLELG